MARIFLENPVEEILGGTVNNIFGSNDAETVTISANSKNQFDQSFNRGNDTIVIQGAAGLYTASVVGSSNLRLTAANGADILIPFGAGVDIQFADGATRTLTYDSAVGKLLLGSQEISFEGNTLLDGGDVDGDVFRLTVGQDDLVGTAGNDTFEARVAQNQLGEQANQYGSGDQLDGGAGTDRLFAKVQDASPLNAGPGGSISAETVDIEIAHFDAEANYGNFGESEFEGSLGVEINAEDMWGLDEIGSVDSDSSLTIYNLTTLTDSGEYEDRRVTESVTVVMDHTGNGDAIHPRANLTVLFDEDYLIAAPPGEQNSSLSLQLLDIDNQITNNQPLLTNPFDTLVFGLTVNGVREEFELAFDARSELSGTAAFQEVINSINSALIEADLPELVATLGSSFTVVDTDGSPGGQASGFNIIITNQSSGTLDAVGFIASGVVPPNTDYQKEVFPTPPEEINDLITVDVVLEKVGRISSAADIDAGFGGGDLTIGGMNTNYANVWGQGGQGVEQFDITVRGDETQPSSLASLQSTNNQLRAVYIESESGSAADLVIGNAETFEQANGALQNAYPFDDDNLFDVTTVRNNGLKDVLRLDSTGDNDQNVGAFVNDLTVNAYFSNEVVEKYINVVDGQPDAAEEDQNALYTLGAGDDTLNVSFSKANFVSLSNEAREDFSFTTFTNDGDDLVQIQIGDGFNGEGDLGETDVPLVQAWYQNHVLAENLTINTGAGNDRVETWGASAADIVLGAGDDVAITDNSGTPEFFDPEFLDADAIQSAYHATWAFNTEDKAGANSILDPLSRAPAAISNVANLTLTVSFQDIEVTVNVGNTVGAPTGATVTDLTINQAIKDAINNSPILSEILVAEDGPGRTLFVRSTIDGTHEVTDLTVNLGVSGPLTGAQTTPGSTATLLGSLTAEQLGLLGITVSGTGVGAVGSFGSPGRYDSEFATLIGAEMDGNDSVTTNNDQVEGGAGNDLIVLSSSAGSVETIDINGVFDEDVILNFTATVGAVATPEVQTITVDGDAILEGEDATATLTLSVLGIELDPITIDGDDTDDTNPTTEEEIADAIEAALEAAFPDDAVATFERNGNAFTVTATTAGADLDDDADDATVQIDGGNEVQTIAFTGDVADVEAGDTVTVFFAGIGGAGGVSIDITEDDLDAADINVAIVDKLFAAFNAVAPGSAAGEGSGTLILTNPIDGNVPSASVLTSSNIDYEVVTTAEGAELGFDVTVSSVDGIDPSIGFDIFDVETVINGAVTLVDNDQQVDGIEAASIAGTVTGVRVVAITDTVEQNDYAFDTTYTGADAERLRILEIANDADNAVQVAAQKSLVITVNEDNVGTFYLINDGTAASDVTVQRLGSVELGRYDLAGKEAIGNWDAMSIDNFDPLTVNELITTFDAQSFL